MDDWKLRYEANKQDVDTLMGRPLGAWGKIKAAFNSNSLTDARKAAIQKVERANRLYQPDNFIGTTGAGAETTYYYRTRNNSFGHITQAHGIPENVGREPHRQDMTYKIENTGPKGVSQEFRGGKVMHTSRNPFLPLSAQASGWERGEQQAREAHQHFKPLADPKVRRAVDERMRRK